MWAYYLTGFNRVVDDFGNMILLDSWNSVLNRMTFILDGAPNV